MWHYRLNYGQGCHPLLIYHYFKWFFTLPKQKITTSTHKSLGYWRKSLNQTEKSINF